MVMKVVEDGEDDADPVPDGPPPQLSKIMSKTLPRKISQIDINIKIRGKFSNKAKKIIERSAKNCPVHHSLNKDMIINLDIEYK